MITDEIVSFEIVSMWRNIDFFYEKSHMTLSLNFWHNGRAINLPVSRAQKTFGPGEITDSTVAKYLC
jgi:hypothetical protein